MANSHTRELFDMASTELADELDRTRQELLNLRFQYATRQNDNYARLRILKRQVARIETILHERELVESEA